jgi:predicted DCC family thiol-disulfide oxidoreductase YuxK
VKTNASTINGDFNSGVIFFDASCPFCTRLATRVERLLTGHGFRFLPLQTPGTAERLGVTTHDLLAEMHLLTSAGQRLRGMDAFVEIARHIWWTRPIYVFAQLPGALPLFRRLYSHLAAHRHCLGGRCEVHHSRKARRVFFEMP